MIRYFLKTPGLWLIALLGVAILLGMYITTDLDPSHPQPWEPYVTDETADGTVDVGATGIVYDIQRQVYIYPDPEESGICIPYTIEVENDSMQFEDGTELSGCITESPILILP